MAVVRRTRNPWKRSMMALRSKRGLVFVLRHGSTDLNLGGVGHDRIRGHADILMTPQGEGEVRSTAWVIGSDRIEVIYASDLQRSMRTAAILSAENVMRPKIETSPLLRSWDMGAAMEGKVTTPDVVALITGWVRNDTVRPPGGESFRSFASRLLSYVEPIFADVLAGDRTIAIVGHGRTCQVIDLWLAAGCDEDCMHREFSEYLAEEPDTVHPGGGLRYVHDGLGWIGQVLGSGEASIGTRIAAGAHVRPANAILIPQGGLTS